VRWLALALLAALTACGGPPAAVPTPPPPVAPQAAPAAVPAAPLPVAVAETAEVVAEPLQAAVEAVSEAIEAVAPESTAAAPPPPLVHPDAVALIVRYEIISPAYFSKRLVRPIWPGGASGVTWCIGYDGGHQTQQVIAQDWWDHPHVMRLALTAGIRGQKARAALIDYRDIVTTYVPCEKVFRERTLIEYERRTARWLRDGYADLGPRCKGGLVSLAYNRGTSTVGDSRREMKEIAQDCVPARDCNCVAGKVREMKRVWKGSSIQAGMWKRRDEEARLIESD
jgi:GH24 family phage-related lysozyme (muramidase)